MKRALGMVAVAGVVCLLLPGESAGLAGPTPTPTPTAKPLAVAPSPIDPIIAPTPIPKPIPIGDTTPPAAVTDLAVVAAGEDNLQLQWTAPGDDGMTGKAKTYDLRYSVQGPITDLTTFNAATPVTGEPVPAVAGTVQGMTVFWLVQGVTYWWSLRTADEKPNWSGISNCPSGTTQPVPPAAVQDLAATDHTDITVTLGWTAPGDDGMQGQAMQYDLRYSTSGPIMTDLDFNAATQVQGMAPPRSPGSPEFCVVQGLTPATAYWFSIKTADDMGNWSPLSNVASSSTGVPGNTPEDDSTHMEQLGCSVGGAVGSQGMALLTLGLAVAGLLVRKIR